MTKERLTIANGTAKADDLLLAMRSDRALGQANDTLLSSLSLSSPSGLPRSLMICSTQPEEGKTLVATMLALTAAQTGRQVLLVDADLRRPRIHQIFGGDNRVGFGNYLAGTKALDESLAVLEVTGGEAGNVVQLSVMSSGPRGSVDFNRIGRDRFGETIGQITARFDLVIIDCPPVLAVNDALFLASVVEGVVFIVDAGAVSQHQAKLAKTRLEKAGAKMLGFVMNRLDEQNLGMSDQPYHRYYAAPDR